jgi:hypothetical protein
VREEVLYVPKLFVNVREELLYVPRREPHLPIDLLLPLARLLFLGSEGQQAGGVFVMESKGQRIVEIGLKKL